MTETANTTYSEILRAAVASRYLRGDGIEIGALHSPLELPSNVTIRYLDRMPTNQLKQTYPELSEYELVEVDILDNGETLATISDDAIDFVIANQMIEHCQNPISTIENWVRVLKPGGILYMGVPDKRYTFDCDRPVTSLKHLVRDYTDGPEWSRDSHFEEWTRLVDKFPEDEVAGRAKGLAALNYSIHFHVWTQVEFLELLNYCRSILFLPIETETLQQNGFEFIIVIRKTSEEVKKSYNHSNSHTSLGENPVNKLKIDLGCGSRKKEGTIGIDLIEQPGVDYALNLQTEPLPFPNQSVEYVHSSHFLEHIENAHYVVQIFKEISRVCVDGAQLELWTPYAWSNSAFVFGHNLFFNEDHYLHLCAWNSNFWEKELKARWLLKEVTYIIDPDVLIELYKTNTTLDFALKYYKDVVREFGVFIEVRHDYKGDNLQFKKTFAVERSATKYPVKSSEVGWNQLELEKALEWFSLGEVERSLFHTQQSPTENEQSQSYMQQTQTELNQLQLELQKTQAELLQAQGMINAMQTSKFWKLRTAWFNVKNSIGLATHGQ